MSQPGHRDAEDFLAALGGELTMAPTEQTLARHVASAADAAKAAHRIRTRRTFRSSAGVLAICFVLGTGSVAVAGRLPTPLQGMAADMARAMPVPLPIPYPVVSPETVLGSADETSSPGIAETGHGLVYSVASKDDVRETAPPDSSVLAEPATHDGSPEVDGEEESWTCFDRSSSERNGEDECVPDTTGRAGTRHDWRDSDRAEGEDQRSRDRPDSDRPEVRDRRGEQGHAGEEAHEGEDPDQESPDGHDRDEHDDDDRYEEEERHPDDRDEQGSSDDEWRDGHD
jgi:hypothetical protein